MRSITGNAQLIDKVYFPREILPLSVVLSNLVNFLLSLAVFLPLALLLGARFSAWTLALPLVIGVQVLLVTGLALLLAALNVFYRDTEVVLDVGLTAWFFLTPIFYELELLPNQFLGIDVWRFVYTLNPMATLVTDYRYILLYQYPVIRFTLVPFVLGVVFLAVGWYLFRRARRRSRKRCSFRMEAVRFEEVSKRFTIHHEKARTFQDAPSTCCASGG